ncbi:MAG: hypothetical protein GY757_17595 [bacterium]|nr:hypothetical protein [bacterium]
MNAKRTIRIDSSGIMENKGKRILVLAANPIDTTWLRLDEELKEIRKALERSGFRDHFKLDMRLAVSNDDIRRAMLDIEPHIVHFTGHGTEAGIILDGDLGSAELASGKALSLLFEVFGSTLECVILSSCYSKPQAEAISKHIDYVIGMNNSILERSGIEFARAFFDTVGAGHPYVNAFKLGRAAILQKFSDLKEHEIPEFFVNERDKDNDNHPRVETVTIRFHILSTGEVFDFGLRLNALTSAEKERLIEHLELPRFTDKKEPIHFSLYSRSRDKLLKDDKTIKENGVQSGENIAFMIDIDDARSFKSG